MAHAHTSGISSEELWTANEPLRAKNGALWQAWMDQGFAEMRRALEQMQASVAQQVLQVDRQFSDLTASRFMVMASPLCERIVADRRTSDYHQN